MGHVSAIAKMMIEMKGVRMFDDRFPNSNTVSTKIFHYPLPSVQVDPISSGYS